MRTSRLTARIDNNAIADGFQIYLHSFVVTREGEWAVVQQGMNEGMRLARRYHWHSAAVRDFTANPHTAIVGQSRGEIRNLVDGRAGPAQSALLAIAREDPARTLAEVRRLEMPRHHDVRRADVDERRLGAPWTTSATSASDCNVRGPSCSRSRKEAKSPTSRSRASASTAPSRRSSTSARRTS